MRLRLQENILVQEHFCSHLDHVAHHHVLDERTQVLLCQEETACKIYTCWMQCKVAGNCRHDTPVLVGSSWEWGIELWENATFRKEAIGIASMANIWTPASLDRRVSSIPARLPRCPQKPHARNSNFAMVQIKYPSQLLRVECSNQGSGSSIQFHIGSCPLPSPRSVVQSPASARPRRIKESLLIF